MNKWITANYIKFGIVEDRDKIIGIYIIYIYAYMHHMYICIDIY